MAIESREMIGLQIPDLASPHLFDAGPALRWPTIAVADLPDDLDLPDSDGEMSENLAELAQTSLLTNCLRPILERIHPDGQYLTGGNSNIYWDFLEPPLRGAIAPDWFYVPNVDGGDIDGHRRRSYVMWKEFEIPFVVMEFVSGDGKKERDRTIGTGKFWLYEQRVRANYYVIHEPFNHGYFEVYTLVGGSYRPVVANERGHVLIPELGVKLGRTWGTHDNMTGPFLRWFSENGELLLSGWERADELTEQMEAEVVRLQVETRRADDQARRAETLAAKLRTLGIDPDDIAGSA